MGVPDYAVAVVYRAREDRPLVIGEDGILLTETLTPLRRLLSWTPSAEEAKSSPQYLLQA